MNRKNLSVLTLGLLLLGFLIVRCAPSLDPIIQFLDPPTMLRFVSGSDPIEPPIVVPVEVYFPPTVNPCAGNIPLPVDPDTLEVKLQRLLDTEVQEEWEIDTSGWLWDEAFETVTGEVTIGGEVAGHNRSAYGIWVSISNGSGVATARQLVRVEIPVTMFFGGYYPTKITSFTQTPAGCVLPDFAIELINDQLSEVVFGVQAPPASQIPATPAVFTNIPLIGNIDFPTSLDTENNNVNLAPVTIEGIDISLLEIPGYNCIVGGSADGVLYGEVAPWADLDGRMRVFNMSIGIGGGSGPCNLVTPGPECNIIINFDGSP